MNAIKSQLFYIAPVVVALSIASPVVSALTFNFNSTGNASADAAFQAAGNLWSSVLTDNVTVNINVGFTALGAGILGSTGSTKGTVLYSDFSSVLAADQTSAFDDIAVDHLSTGSSFGMLINGTFNNPNGFGSTTYYLDQDGDANNSKITLTTANAKALGFYVDPAVFGAYDANITFSSSFTWDFNDADGITAGAFDFIGIAAHEIGHALGFISGVDILDDESPNGTTYYPDDQFTYVSPVDLFRYSTDSIALGVIDWTADTREKYFSIDGGTTALVTFATGKVHGDGRQASHWEDNLGLGLMDPTASSGEFLKITANDLIAFDVIGWDLRLISQTVSEPSILTLLLAGFASIMASLQQIFSKCSIKECDTPIAN